MGLVEWAEKEVELACKKENPNWDGKSFDYGIACYQSALKAFKSLCEDEHSLMSIGFTQGILNRLIDVKCLTPIEDTEDIWNEITVQEDGSKCYQCKRMSSLFKDVSPNGEVSYHDNDRAALIDENGMRWHNGRASRLIHEMYPIKMPYYPPQEPYKIYEETFLVDPANGDYDTWGYSYLITPEGERVELNKFWAKKNGESVEISKEEFEERKAKRVDCKP